MGQCEYKSLKKKHLVTGVEQRRALPGRRGRPAVGGLRPRLRRARRPRTRQDHRRTQHVPSELTHDLK